MNCRRGWKTNNPEDVAKISMLATKAKLCESCNHYAMAAILWRKLGEEKMAEDCEVILAKNAMENKRVHG